MRRQPWNEGVQIEVVARLLGIPVPTIRSWERRYDVPAPARTTGGHRRYSHDDVVELRIMRDEIGRGRSAREAADGVGRRRGRSTEGMGAAAEAFLAAVEAADPRAMRASLDSALEELGLERAITQVALTSMREIGFRWEAGVCDVGAEHLASMAVRGWLARLASSLMATSSRPVVLACGPKDLHTIGLEAFGVLLLDAGVGSATLGAQVPEASLLNCVDATDASAVVVVSSMATTRQAAVAALRAVARDREAPAFYAGAAFTRPTARRGVAGTYLGDDLADARRLVVEAVGAPVAIG